MIPPAILHIDDDADDVLLMQHACRKAALDFKLQTVGDGDEAVAYLRGTGRFADREQHPLPRILLLDLKLPRVSGFEVLSWLRQSGQFHRLPVVVLSSSNHEIDVKRAYDAGANSYLVKPVGFDSLVNLVKAIHYYWLTLNEPPDR